MGLGPKAIARLHAAAAAGYSPALRALAVLHGRIDHPHPQQRCVSLLERAAAAGNRLRTVCVYLNAVEAGGQTDFPVAGVSVQPRAGSVVCFDNLHADGRPDPDSLHAGLPVVAGTKWLGTLWMRQQRYRDW
ncbi:hypothetical protein FHR50_000269 [Xanthomonas arboricola]